MSKKIIHTNINNMSKQDLSNLSKKTTHNTIVKAK